MADKGPGSKTQQKSRRNDELRLQQSLPGNRRARRAARRLQTRQESYDALKSKDGYRRPGSMKGQV